jgi:hypothetical protein
MLSELARPCVCVCATVTFGWMMVCCFSSTMPREWRRRKPFFLRPSLCLLMFIFNQLIAASFCSRVIRSIARRNSTRKERKKFLQHRTLWACVGASGFPPFSLLLLLLPPRYLVQQQSFPIENVFRSSSPHLASVGAKGKSDFVRESGGSERGTRHHLINQMYARVGRADMEN